MNLQFSDMIKGNAFPNEPLDEKDRKIIEAAYKYAHVGVGFNKFVQEVKLFASRSTVPLLFLLKRCHFIQHLLHEAVQKQCNQEENCNYLIANVGGIRALNEDPN